MKEYTLIFYVSLTDPDISYSAKTVIASSVEIKDRCLVFTDNEGNLVAIYPSEITAIISVKSTTKE